MALEAELLVALLKSIQEQLDQVEKATQRLAEGFEEYDYLKSIPGFGPYVSAVTLAAIGNPYRFENRSQLIRLAGFDLCASRSGEKSNTAVPVISKKSKADLRYALYQAAVVASSLTNHFRSHYNRPRQIVIVTLALRDQVRHVGRVLGVVLVPATIDQNSAGHGILLPYPAS